MTFQLASRALTFVMCIAFVAASIAFAGGRIDRTQFIMVTIVAIIAVLNAGTSDLFRALGKKNG